MKISELLKFAIKKLNENNIDESHIKAKKLLKFILKKNDTYLIANSNQEVLEDKEKIYMNYIEEIIKGKPIQYITKRQEFMGMNFYVDENVLIPQPDTEVLVEEAIKKINDMLNENIKIDILDLCTGSGIIAISIAKYLENKKIEKSKYKIYGTDISNNALKIAKKNSIQNEANVEFILSDMFKNLNNKKFDIIISNPPYIETDTIKTLSKEVQNEPSIALNGGIDGLKFYKIIAKEAKSYLKQNGIILVEIGYNQKEDVSKVFKEQNFKNIKSVKDLSGNDRVEIFIK